MKNKITDMNDHLFAQLERLSDEDLTGDQLESEIKRTRAVVEIADTIISSAKTSVEAAKVVAEYGSVLPEVALLGVGNNQQRVVRFKRNV